jgi:hypothetical protein
MSFRRFMIFMVVANAGRDGSALVIPNRPSNVSAPRWHAMLRHFNVQGYETLLPQRCQGQAS